MTFRFHSAVLLATVLAACANLSEKQVNSASDAYLACLNTSADRYTDNPAGAEQIALTAQGECWTEWTAYRDQIQTSYISGATSPEAQQLARDKADAHLRQVEQDARRAVMSRVIQRAYGVPNAP